MEQTPSRVSEGPEAVDALAALLAPARRMLIFTGAGISTGSGIPDFRGPQGVWTTRTPVYYQDFMSSQDARHKYWSDKLEDHTDYASARPNPVHAALARLEKAELVELTVTQNVDGLHRAAGVPDERLVEVHGTNAKIECQTCGELSEPEQAFADFAAGGEPPLCHCGGYLKTATISFGQALRADELARAFAAAERADLVLALGSTLSVAPASSIPLVAVDRGTPYVIVNRGETDHDAHPGITLRIEGDVAAVVPPAVDRLLGVDR